MTGHVVADPCSDLEKFPVELPQFATLERLTYVSELLRVRTVTLEAFVAANGQRLVTFAYLVSRDRELAQDAVQNVLLNVSERDFQTIDDPLAYCRTAIVNEIRSSARRASLLARILPALAPNPARAVVDDQTAVSVDLWRLMARLPTKQRVALVLKYYEDLTDIEIASVLQCAPATVRSHLSRGMTNMRRDLNPKDES